MMFLRSRVHKETLSGGVQKGDLWLRKKKLRKGLPGNYYTMCACGEKKKKERAQNPETLSTNARETQSTKIEKMFKEGRYCREMKHTVEERQKDSREKL